MCLRSLLSLPIVADVFACARRLARLFLNISKCVLVPLFSCIPRGLPPPAAVTDSLLQDCYNLATCSMITSNAVFCDVVRWARFWPDRFLLAWCGLETAPCLLYLGTFLGPAVGDKQKQWEAPIAKYMERSCQIAAGAGSPFLSVHLYVIRAVPCLGYVAQLLRLPLFAETEKRMITQVFRRNQDAGCARRASP